MPRRTMTSLPSSKERSPSKMFDTAYPDKQRFVSSWEQCPKRPMRGEEEMPSSMSLRSVSMPRVRTREQTNAITAQGAGGDVALPRTSWSNSQSARARAEPKSRRITTSLLSTSAQTNFEEVAALCIILTRVQANSSRESAAANRSASTRTMPRSRGEPIGDTAAFSSAHISPSAVAAASPEIASVVGVLGPLDPTGVESSKSPAREGALDGTDDGAAEEGAVVEPSERQTLMPFASTEEAEVRVLPLLPDQRSSRKRKA
mmetsp:Transcript_32771/g.83194  ORF Transcript_32771/g.83194 Transcript_32771/m.83194 type:complete len:260 (-) Transcript_32771:441-1220(-)